MAGAKRKPEAEGLFDDDLLRRCLAMTPRQRLMALSRLNAFLDAAMPVKSKRAWEKLKISGF